MEPQTTCHPAAPDQSQRQEKEAQLGKEPEVRGEGRPLSPKESDIQSSVASDISMKELMEEANKMLRSMPTSAGGSAASASSATKEEEARSDVLERLQQQLNSMKLKVLGIGKVMKSGD